MNDQQVSQRIKYLVEHGGIAEDPLDDLHRRVRLLTYPVSTALTLNVCQLILHVVA